MEAGKLRHRLQFETPDFQQDANTGAMTPAWTLVTTLWGTIEPLSGRDFIAAQAAQSNVVARMVIRYNTLITAGMRVTNNGKYYMVEAVLPDADSGREYMTLPVSEGTRTE